METAKNWMDGTVLHRAMDGWMDGWMNTACHDAQLFSVFVKHYAKREEPSQAKVQGTIYLEHFS